MPCSMKVRPKWRLAKKARQLSGPHARVEEPTRSAAVTAPAAMGRQCRPNSSIGPSITQQADARSDTIFRQALASHCGGCGYSHTTRRLLNPGAWGDRALACLLRQPPLWPHLHGTGHGSRSPEGAACSRWRGQWGAGVQLGYAMQGLGALAQALFLEAAKSQPAGPKRRHLRRDALWTPVSAQL